MAKFETYLPTILNSAIADDDIFLMSDKSNSYKIRAMTFLELDKRYVVTDGDSIVDGNIQATNFIGDGSGLTGFGGTGGIINTGSTTLGADSDADGVGVIALQTRGVTRVTVANLGSLELNDVALSALNGINSVGEIGKASLIIGGGAATTLGINYVTRFDIAAASTRVASFTLAGNFKLGGSAGRGTTEGTKYIDIFDGTAPVGTLANGISLYSTAGELRVMDAAGNATLLSPHEKNTNEWIYDSVDSVTGKRLKIQMELIMKAINKKFGWDFIKESQIEI